MKYLNKKYIPVYLISLLIVLMFAISTNSGNANAQTPPPAGNINILRSSLRGLYISLPNLDLYIPSSIDITNRLNGNVAHCPLPYGKSTCGGFTTNVSTVDVNGVTEARVQISGFKDSTNAKIAYSDVVKKLSGINITEAAATANYSYHLNFSNAPMVNVKNFYNNFSGQLPDNMAISTNPSCSNITRWPTAANKASYPYLCGRVDVSFRTFTTNTKTSLWESILMNSSVIVNGNVAANGTIKGIKFPDPTGSYIAVGGSASTNGNNINSYLSSSSLLNKTAVTNQINGIINDPKVTGYVSSNLIATAYSANPTWNLNSKGNDPKSGVTDSFSSQPGGKLWVYNTNMNFSSLTINGRGTIIVNGDVSIGGNVTCTTGSNVAIIARGNITINGSIAKCGTFVSMGSTGIVLNKTITGNENWKTVLISMSDIKLPKVTTGQLTVNYDTDMANNPTVLMKDVFKATFSSDR